LAVPLVLAPMCRRYTMDGEVAQSESVERDASCSVLQLRCGSHMIPKEGKSNGGEDAMFIGRDAAGVFDGVGGWVDRGVDPGHFSRFLATTTAKYMDMQGPHAAIDALKRAVAENPYMGTSTASVVGLTEGNLLKGVNVGDSGILVLRGNDIVFRSSEQQVFFNKPFQLGTESMHTVDHGDRVEVDLRENDVIILATDGVFDNLFDKDLQELVAQHRELSTDAIAKLIAESAEKNASRTQYDSPFAQHARRAGFYYIGGKPDDITVLFCKACVSDGQPKLPNKL